MSLPVFLLSLVLCLFLGGGRAQYAACPGNQVGTSDAPGPWDWMYNRDGFDPCLLVAYLQIPCNGMAPSDNLLSALPQGQFYTGPRVQNDCLCNTVVYSLIEGCQLCQHNDSALEQPWSGFTYNCTTTTNGSFPFYTSHPIPSWAFQDVLVSDRFNLTVAQQEAQGISDPPDSTSTPSAASGQSTTATATTSSGHSSSHSSSASATATTGVAAADAGSGKSSNVGAIAGGVVGGVAGIALLGTVVFYLLHRRRKLQRQTQLETSERPISTTTTALDDSPSSLKPVSMVSSPPMIYDPDDPRTFPSSQTSPSPSALRAVSPTPSGPPGSVGGRMHGFGPMQNYSTSSFYGGDQGHSTYSAATYKGVPEI